MCVNGVVAHALPINYKNYKQGPLLNAGNAIVKVLHRVMHYHYLNNLPGHSQSTKLEGRVVFKLPVSSNRSTGQMMLGGLISFNKTLGVSSFLTCGSLHLCHGSSDSF